MTKLSVVTIKKMVEEHLGDSSFINNTHLQDFVDILAINLKSTDNLPALLKLFSESLDDAYDVGVDDYPHYQDQSFFYCSLQRYTGSNSEPTPVYEDVEFDSIVNLMQFVVEDRAHDLDLTKAQVQGLHPNDLKDVFNYVLDKNEIVETFTTYMNVYDGIGDISEVEITNQD